MSAHFIGSMKDGPVPWLAPRFFFQGLVWFGLAKSRGVRRLRRRGRGFLKKLQTWLLHGNVNCYPMILILQAEDRSFDADLDEIRAAFDKAISVSGRLGQTNFDLSGSGLGMIIQRLLF